MADRDRLLGFRRAPDRRHVHRLRAFHHSGRNHHRRNSCGADRVDCSAAIDENRSPPDGAPDLRGFSRTGLRTALACPGRRENGFRQKANPARRTNRIHLDTHGDDADFVVGEEKSLWSDYFAREKDQLLLHCSSAKIADREYTNMILRFHYNRVQIGLDNFELDHLDEISGTANEIEIPREAMGRGDLKFLACDRRFSRLACRSLRHLRRLALRFRHRPRHANPRQTRLVAQTPLRPLPRPRRYHLDVLRRFNRALVPNIVASVLSPIPNELARIDTINRIGNHKAPPSAVSELIL